MSRRGIHIPAPIVKRIMARGSIYERHLDITGALFKNMILRDTVTADHSLIMAHYSYQLPLICDGDQADLYYAGSLTHDIGKLGMKDEILKGTRKLSSEERVLLREKVKDRASLLRELKMPLSWSLT